MNEIILYVFFFTILSTGVVKQTEFDEIFKFIMEKSWKSQGILGQKVCTNPVVSSLYAHIWLTVHARMTVFPRQGDCMSMSG